MPVRLWVEPSGEIKISVAATPRDLALHIAALRRDRRVSGTATFEDFPTIDALEVRLPRTLDGRVDRSRRAAWRQRPDGTIAADPAVVDPPESRAAKTAKFDQAITVAQLRQAIREVLGL